MLQRCPMVFITLQSSGENEYGKTGHSKIFTFLTHFLIILKRNFFTASILHHITDTDKTYIGPCMSDLTLINDVCKGIIGCNGCWTRCVMPGRHMYSWCRTASMTSAVIGAPFRVYRAKAECRYAVQTSSLIDGACTTSNQINICQGNNAIEMMHVCALKT